MKIPAKFPEAQKMFAALLNIPNVVIYWTTLGEIRYLVVAVPVREKAFNKVYVFQEDFMDDPDRFYKSEDKNDLFSSGDAIIFDYLFTRDDPNGEWVEIDLEGNHSLETVCQDGVPSLH